MREEERAASQLMQTQFGAISHGQALGLGLTPKQVGHLLSTGRWSRLHRSVYASTTSPDSPRRRMAAALLGVGEPAAASHLSAAWMLGLSARAPELPHVTVAATRRPRLQQVAVHRSCDFDPARTIEIKGLRCTDTARTLSDMAGLLVEEQLSPLIDAALARRLTTTTALEKEVRRRSAQGRVGPSDLDRLLRQRGFTGGPEPSVLEAKMLRLLRRWQIPVRGREVIYGSHGQYRLDFQITPGLVVEVDGFAFHWSPEAKRHDDRRRNDLRAGGLFVLVYSWRDVRFDDRRVAAEIRAQMAQTAQTAAGTATGITTGAGARTAGRARQAAT